MTTEKLITAELRNGAFSYLHNLTLSPEDSQHTTYMSNCYQIYYLLSGSVVYQVEGQYYRLNPGDLLIINNKEIHRPFFTSDENYERILIFFTPEFCNHYNNEGYSILQYFDKRKPGCFNRLPSNIIEKEKIIRYFNEMEEQIRCNFLQSKTLIELTFIRLLIYINEIIDSSRVTTASLEFDYNQKIEEIIQFINNNLIRQLTLKEIEETFYINKYYFSHLFKKNTGFSFKEYIINKRIAKATELLKLSMSPTEACRISGFDDYSNFYKAFKNIIGVAPSKYK